MIILAMRESVLNALDVVFKQPNSNFQPYRSKINFGKGVLIKENVVDLLICEDGDTPLGISDSKKFREKFPGIQGAKCVKSKEGKYIVRGSQGRSSDQYDSIDSISGDAIKAVLN